MTEIMNTNELVALFDDLKVDASHYFERVEKNSDIKPPILSSLGRDREFYWKKLTPEVREEAKKLEGRLLSLAGNIAEVVKKAPLASEADQSDLITGTKAMRAALSFRDFRSWGIEVLHDEGQVLGIQPPGQTESESATPAAARKSFFDWAGKIQNILDLVAASKNLSFQGDYSSSAGATKYRPGTAFVMMSIDKNRPELDDVVDTVRKVFGEFGVNAVRADEIEHEGQITTRILSEIETSEFLFADLTDQRPNVYYEVGYAHAMKRRVILFRKAGTGLHFDLAGYNCPGYENLRDLREQLTKRLKSLTNKYPKTS